MHYATVTSLFFFFQAEDGIRDLTVTGVQTCALPIYARQRFSVLIERGRIADHENFRMIWNSKIGLDAHATGAIGLRPQPFSSRRRCDTGRPDDRFACYALAPEGDPFAVDLFDRLAQVDFDAKFLQMLLRRVGETWRKCSENFLRSVNQDNPR